MGAKHSKPKETPVHLNFAAQPTAQEESIHATIQQLVSQFPQTLESIQSYEARDKEIRAAIATPSPETEEAAWQAILPQVTVINGFFELGKTLKTHLKQCVAFLCKGDGASSVTQFQAVTIQVCEIIDFAHRFDAAKLLNPGLQNDFSYYRRSLGKMKAKHRDDITLKDDVTNQISMFFAVSSPMLMNLAEALNDALKEGMVMESLCGLLRCIAISCMAQSAERGDVGIKCLRIMTSCILLFDTVVPLGVFNPKSAFGTYNCIKTLKAYPENQDEVTSLLNSIKFSSKHLKDDDTPKNIAVLLM